MKRFPWDEPAAPEHVRVRQPVMEIKAFPGIRKDLPVRRLPDELPWSLQQVNFGIVIMTHRGSSNGRLSVLLSSIPSNYPVLVSSDSISDVDIKRDEEVAKYHGADFTHCTPWGGRARNAQNCMEKSSWDRTLFLCDDVWLFPECVSDALRWTMTFYRHDIPVAVTGVPGWETYHNHKQWGFEDWDQCLNEPWLFEKVPPNPTLVKTPALYKNPFGACMVINRVAYNDLGGFASEYWAHDDVFNHKVWVSNRWVNVMYPGRGYMHLGAQSWHHGESVEYVGEFKDATGMSADESGAAQVASIYRWKDKLHDKFVMLGGSPAV
jgi:hypothetical protein